MAVNILFDEVDYLPKQDDGEFEDLTKEDLNLINYINITTGSKLDRNGANNILKELKVSLIGAFLFILLSLPQVNYLFEKTSQNKYYQVIIKVIVFIFLFYILQNRF